MLKLNVNGVARGEPGSVGIDGVLCNHDGLLLFYFSSSIGVKESSEAEIISIIEVLRSFSVSFRQTLIVESDSLNLISWVSNETKGSWRFYFYLNEIKCLSLELDVEFRHIPHSAN